MKRRFSIIVFSVLTVICLLSAMAVSAEGYGILVGGVELTDTLSVIDSSVADSGVAAGTVTYQDGTLTLDGAVIAPDDAAAIHVKPGVEVDIVLVGENKLTGALGCAGIFVEAGWDDDDNFSKDASAKVTITGEGSLVAVGGNSDHGTKTSAAAGIGGNGVPNCVVGGDFGVIVIEGGTITATGGDDDTDTHPSAGSCLGAGAGIGGGGIDGGWRYSGYVEIKGGNVTANGGNGYVGGAGIGSGSAGSSGGTLSDIEIIISGGAVTANGGTDAAGIGGSSNGAGSPIVISGGTVIANGGDEGDGTSYGGAGIGGGDGGESDDITISGNAVVIATAGGAAAGVGGGNGGSISNIIIEDSASVTAFGGSAYSRSLNGYKSGAAIGSGNQGDFGVPESLGRITINTTGKIVAYGGIDAMSIGVGTGARSKYYFEVGAKTGEIWMFNQGTAQPAYIDDPEYLVNYRATLTAQYNLPDGETYPAEGTIAKAMTLPESVAIDWKYENDTLTVLRDGEVVISGGYEIEELGNWAVVIPQVDMYVTYAWDGDLPAGDYEQELPEKVKVSYGDEFDVNDEFTADTVIENVVDGVVVGKWTFSGWDKSGTITIEDSVVIKGTWYYESYLSIEFEKTVDEHGNPVEARGEKIYDINIVAYNGKDINRLNSVDLSFVLDNTYGKNAYEIIDIADDNIAVNFVEEDRYEFHFVTKTNVTNDTAASITIARVKFTGYGKFTFAVDADADTNEVHATKLADNLVDTYVPGGKTADGKKVGTLVIADFVDEEIFTPVQNLTINIAFPNNVNYVASDYQSMNVTVTGSDIEKISIDLGDDVDTVKLDVPHKPDAQYSVSFDEDTCVCTIELTGILTANRTYSVAVSGEGYRTARYAVNTAETDKTLNFWNNVKDSGTEVELGEATSKTVKNFLAGEIVKDNEINIYDLSAVVSYFGSENLADEHPEYVKYDLNRDGVIDSKDVAYVLVSWGE